MTSYAALLRAINVGGTGTLLMKDLIALCEASGLLDVATYIQSGNVVFTSRLSEAAIATTLERALAAKVGKPVGVLIRTADELASIAKRNPFKAAAPNRVVVFLLPKAPARAAIEAVVIPAREEVRADGREVFVHYPDGQGRSKLKLPFADVGTGRNLNTINTLAEMTRASSERGTT
jgi:uncharacterized protein (DUF1697 family)